MKFRALRPQFRFLSSLLAAVALLTVAVQPAAAAPPWQFASFKKIDADPNKNYPVAESNGPWMIMVTTFHGDTAERQAQQLVYELRKQFKLNAYSQRHDFDYTQKGFEGQGLNPDGTPKKMKYANPQRFEEVAVLVGDFHAVDDPEGQKVLAMLKRAQPDCLKSHDNTPPPSNPLADLRSWTQRTLGGSKENGPLAGAFMTTNPLLPREYFAPKGPSKLVLDMNSGVRHSLLNCKGHYSVQVATFTGHVTIDQHEIHQIERGSDPSANGGMGLEEAALKAHALTEFLRDAGVEAYEFHDRYSSIVTIGSFDSVGSPRQDGKIEINPQVYAIMKKYGTDQGSTMTAGGAEKGFGQKVVYVKIRGEKKAIAYDMQPMPIEIPRRSISSDYQQMGR